MSRWKKTGKRVLSLDWDWVTGDCANHRMCHAHCGWCDAHGVNGIRMGPRKGRGRSIRRKLHKAAVEDRYWDFIGMLHRLQNFNPRRIQGPVFVAECHADIMNILSMGTDVWTLDAHHDCNSGTGLHCGSWESIAQSIHCKIHRLGYHTEVVDTICGLPVTTWHTGHSEIATYGAEAVRRFCRRVDAVFICKSSPFTPEEYDQHFNSALAVLAKGNELKFIGHKAVSLKRSYRAFRRKR